MQEEKKEEVGRSEDDTGKGRGKKFRQASNILTRMPKALGPLGMLYEFMETRKRIRSSSRSSSGGGSSGSSSSGSSDITNKERTTRIMTMMTEKEKEKEMEMRKKREKEEEEEREGKATFVPKVVLKKIEGKTETLERHVPQMLLRGEQVAIIVKIN
ncbi:hypothetical protein M0802_002094 [Mischocyttarus mexicanus]|nr:hypothetical protein M0802_002094 [Mischocyttarus mexicanus]